MVPWPSGEATVCKTVYSSSILLGTSKALMQMASALFFCWQRTYCYGYGKRFDVVINNFLVKGVRIGFFLLNLQ